MRIPLSLGKASTVAAGAVIRNRRGEILVVKPTYKPDWSLPGGLVKWHETPLEGCLREVQEETGLRLRNPKLVIVSHHLRKWGPDGVGFWFDGGVVPDHVKIKLPRFELNDHQFVKPLDAMRMLPPTKAATLQVFFKAMSTGRVVYVDEDDRR